MSAIEKMDILNELNYQEDQSLSLDIRYFCDEVELVAESFSIVFKGCFKIESEMDLIYKDELIKYQQNVYRIFTVISIDIEDHSFTSNGILGSRNGDRKIVAQGYKVKIDLDELFLTINCLDIDIRPALNEERKLKQLMTYIDV